VQAEKLDPHGPPALLMNLVGAILIIISLVHDFNLPAFVLESVWGLISAYGLAKWLIRRKKTRD